MGITEEKGSFPAPLLNNPGFFQILLACHCFFLMFVTQQ
jgi:hypothetical protein